MDRDKTIAVVDDASLHRTGEALKDQQQKDSRIVIHRSREKGKR